VNQRPGSSPPTGNGLLATLLAVYRNRRRLTRNVASNYLGFAIQALVNLLLTPFLVHRLGNTQFGIWILLNAIIAYLQLMEMGLMFAIVRYTAYHSARDEKRDVESVIGSALAFLFLVSLLTLPVAAGLAWVGPSLFELDAANAGYFTGAILLTGLITIAAYFRRLFYAVLEGYQRFVLLNISSVSGALLGAGATVVLVERGHGVPTLLVILALRMLYEFALEFTFVRRILGLRPSPRLATRSHLRTLAGYSSYAFLMDVALKVTYSIDAFVIGLYLPVARITPYSIANQISGAIQDVADPLVALFFPMASELHAKQSSHRLRQLIVRGSQTTLLLILPGVLIAAWHGATIINWWLGPEYVEQSLPILYVLLGVCVAGAFSETPGHILMAVGKVRFVALVSCSKAILKLSLALILVQRLGVVGVVWATLAASLLLTNLVSVTYACRLVGTHVVSWYLRVAAPGAAVSLAALGVFRFVTSPIDNAVVVVIADVLAAGLLTGLALLVSLRRDWRS
jgi:O-antigen/teichoic acid export membrane protein